MAALLATVAASKNGEAWILPLWVFLSVSAIFNFHLNVISFEFLNLSLNVNLVFLGFVYTALLSSVKA